MTKCLSVASAVAAVNITGSILFLALAKPTVWNVWPAFGTHVQPLDPASYLTTPGQASFCEPMLVSVKSAICLAGGSLCPRGECKVLTH